MKIYISHSRAYDYENELYLPVRQMKENEEHEIILPHENGHNEPHTREFYKSLDMMIAECSYPATGLGMELAYAADDQTPIYCIYKKGHKVSGSVHSVTDQFMEYSDAVEMTDAIGQIISKEVNKRRGENTK